MNLPGYMQGYNHSRSENVDELGGSYSVSETWLIASGAAIEDFDVDIKTGVESGLTQVSIKGTITGLDTRDTNFQIDSSRYENASVKFAAIEPYILTRAQTYSGTTLNTEFLNKSVGKNPISGVITYSYDYDDRPSMCLTGIVPGLKSEFININDNNGTDVFATIFVLGRAEGPVLQDLGTIREKTREITIDLVVRPSSGCLAEKPTGVDAFALNYMPNADCVFTHINSEQWSPSNGKYVRNIGWTYT
jgi:hypothetical protein